MYFFLILKKLDEFLLVFSRSRLWGNKITATKPGFIVRARVEFDDRETSTVFQIPEEKRIWLVGFIKVNWEWFDWLTKNTLRGGRSCVPQLCFKNALNYISLGLISDEYYYIVVLAQLRIWSPSLFTLSYMRINRVPFSFYFPCFDHLSLLMFRVPISDISSFTLSISSVFICAFSSTLFLEFLTRLTFLLNHDSLLVHLQIRNRKWHLSIVALVSFPSCVFSTR